METVKNFFADYGYSFLMMVVIGSVIALITEITIKKALAWLEGKLEGRTRALAVLAAVKTVSIQCATWLMVIVFTRMLVENMPLPANRVFYPIWLCLVYVIQYLFSCWGIKGLVELIRRRAEKTEEEADGKKEKDPLEGLDKISDNLYTDGRGSYFMLKGRKVVKV